MKDENKQEKQDTPLANEEAPIVEEIAEEKAENEQKAHHESKEKHPKKEKKIKVSETEIVELRKKAEELDATKESFLRKVADFENAKKRLAREKEDFAKFANEKIVSSFLPVLDNLERALEHGGKPITAESVLEGVVLIKKQIEGILKNNGLEKVEAIGKKFDPHFHEAIGTVETDEHSEDNVAEEVQCGYMFKNKLLRPSWVRVAVEKNVESGA